MKIAHFWGLCLAVCFGSNSFAQIQFEHGTWAEAVQKAKSENKLVFIDAYAQWCGPCKWMATNVFTDATVGNYFNANFVNLKLDMETADGGTFNEKYKITSYPSFMFLDGAGNVIHKTIGSRGSEEFLQEAKTASSKFNKTPNPKPDPKHQEQPSEASEKTISKWADVMAKEYTNCFREPLRVFDKDVLKLLEKVTGMTETEADAYFAKQPEDLQNRLAEQVATAFEKSESLNDSACNENLEKALAPMEKELTNPNDQEKAFELFIERIKKQPDAHHVYVWFKFLAAMNQ